MAALVWLNYDQLVSAGNHIEKVWGHGYHVTSIGPSTPFVSVFQMRFGDGSELRFAVDKWGNVRDLPAGDHDRQAAVEAFAAAAREL